MNTCITTLGTTKQVAMKNWSNDTDDMLCCEGIRSKLLAIEKLTANSEFDQAHGTSEDIRMSMIKGIPLDRCRHLLLSK